MSLTKKQGVIPLHFHQTLSKSMSQLIYKNGCWTCKRSMEDPQQQYICPQVQQHWTDYQKHLEKEF